MRNLTPFALVAFLSGCQLMGLAPENIGPPSSTNFKTYNDRGQQAYAQMSDVAQSFRISVGDSIQFAETSYRDNSHKLRYVTGKSTKQITGQASLESVGGICTYGDTIGTLNKESLFDYEITVPDVYYQGFDVRVALVGVPSQIIRPLDIIHLRNNATYARYGAYDFMSCGHSSATALGARTDQFTVSNNGTAASRSVSVVIKNRWSNGSSNYLMLSYQSCAYWQHREFNNCE